jgi:DNA-binding phage protein
VYKARRPTIDRDAVKALRNEGMGAIARERGIGRASVYRVLE